MALSWKEIKDCALKFSREWADKASEDAEAQSFWNGFFDVFGVSRRRFANFERRVKKIDDKDGYIDLLRKGVLLVEHKSRGRRERHWTTERARWSRRRWRCVTRKLRPERRFAASIFFCAVASCAQQARDPGYRFAIP